MVDTPGPAGLIGAVGRQVEQALAPAKCDRSLRLVRLVARRLAHAGAAQRPPACPPGWRTGPPDFVGVGVQKAGTSWWYRLVTDHPQVSSRLDQPKELHYFGRFNERPFTAADAARYGSFFPRPDGTKSGEWTPRYLPDFWTHRQLRSAAPDAKLLVIVRDPVERYRSGITHEVNRGTPRGPSLAIEAMFRGLYHLQLTALLRHFPRDQVLVLQHEQCRTDPLSQLARTYEFLDLDVDFVPPGLERTVNPTPTEKIPLPPQIHDELMALYQPDVLALATDFPEVDLSLWPNFGDLVSGHRRSGARDQASKPLGLAAGGHPLPHLRSVASAG